MSEVNFLPASYLRERAGRRRGMLHAGLIAASLVFGVGFFMLQRTSLASLRTHVHALEARAEVAKREETQAARLLQEHATLLRQTRLQRELAPPITHTQIIAVLGQALPKTVFLSQVEMTAVRPQPPEGAAKKPAKDAPPQPQRLDVTLAGVAPDDLTVANVIGTLGDHPLFDGVMLKQSRATQLRGVAAREFTLALRVDLERQVKPRREEVALAP